MKKGASEKAYTPVAVNAQSRVIPKTAGINNRCTLIAPTTTKKQM
jgi:hypothetical protein